MNNRIQSLLCLTFLAALLSCVSRSGTESVDAGIQVSAISGELKQWHRVMLSFAGPETSEYHLLPTLILRTYYFDKTNPGTSSTIETS